MMEYKLQLKECWSCVYKGVSTMVQPCRGCFTNESKRRPLWIEREMPGINNRDIVLQLIDEERNRQDAKWGEQNHAQFQWVGILGEEFGEYCQAVNETYLNNATEQHKGGIDNMMEELTHVAAVTVGAMESLMRNKEEE